jgi:ribosome maturation factor RimP
MAQRARGPVTGARATGGRTDRARVGADRAGTELVTLRTRLRTIIEPIVGAAGLDLEDLAVARAGRRHVIRVTVDGDRGVSHDELGEVSHEISAGLDAAEEAGGDLVAGSYALEVSSPGVDRPLTLPRHWRRNAGRLVTVRVGGASLTQRVASVDDAGVTFADGTVAGFDQLGPGHVQVEFTHGDGDDIDGDDTEQEDGA